MFGSSTNFLLLLLFTFVPFFLPLKSALAQDEPALVRVGIYENAPKVFTDSSGAPAGVFVDILNVIAIQENWKIEYVPGTFEEGLARVNSGDIDIMVDVAANPEREEQFTLSQETVLSSWGVVYVKKGSQISSWQDLDQQKVGILKSSVYYTGPAGLKQYAGAFHLELQLQEVTEYDELFKQLSEGTVDAAVVSRISGLTAEAAYPNIRATDIIFMPTELRFALHRTNPRAQHLRNRLDFWVTKLRDGYGEIYPAILERHNLLGLLGEKKVAPKWVLPFTLLADIGLIVSWAITFIFAYLYKRSLGKIRRLEGKWGRSNKKVKS